MNSSIDGTKLTIFLEGHINSSNSAQIDDEIKEKCESSSYEELFLDAEKLNYISSAGLRVILNLAKKKIPLKVINASNEVYEIFSVTGFTDIIDVSKAMRSISVEGCEVIGTGGHGTVYRLDAESIVKVYTDNSTVERIQEETRRAKKAFIHGIPTAISYDTVKCGDKYGAVYEMIRSETLAQYLTNNPSDIKLCAKKCAELFKSMHTTKVPKSEFPSIKNIYNSYSDRMKAYLSAKNLDLLYRIIDTIPDAETFIHNDFHPGNIMLQDGELLLIDMSEMSFGHPIFDFAATNLTLIVAGEMMPKNTIQIFGLEYTLCVELWNKIIKCYFNTTDEAKIERINAICRLFGGLKFAIAPAISAHLDSESLKMIVMLSEKQFFSRAQEVIDGIKEFDELLKEAGV